MLGFTFSTQSVFSQYTPSGVIRGIRYRVIIFYQQCTPKGVKNAIGFIPEITMHQWRSDWLIHYYRGDEKCSN